MVEHLTVDKIIDETQDIGKIYKFVKVKGEYRFIEVVFYGPVHADLVEDDETAEAAGTIQLRPNWWEMSDWYSSTLNIGCGGKEEDELQKLLGRTPRSAIVMRKYEEDQRKRCELDG